MVAWERVKRRGRNESQIGPIRGQSICRNTPDAWRNRKSAQHRSIIVTSWRASYASEQTNETRFDLSTRQRLTRAVSVNSFPFSVPGTDKRYASFVKLIRTFDIVPYSRYRSSFVDLGTRYRALNPPVPAAAARASDKYSYELKSLINYVHKFIYPNLPPV